MYKLAAIPGGDLSVRFATFAQARLFARELNRICNLQCGAPLNLEVVRVGGGTVAAAESSTAVRVSERFGLTESSAAKHGNGRLGVTESSEAGRVSKRFGVAESSTMGRGKGRFAVR